MDSVCFQGSERVIDFRFSLRLSLGACVVGIELDDALDALESAGSMLNLENSVWCARRGLPMSRRRSAKQGSASCMCTNVARARTPVVQTLLCDIPCLSQSRMYIIVHSK